MYGSPASESVPARSVLDALSTAVLVLDPGFGIEYLNPAAEMLLGASARGRDVSALLPRDTALRAHLARAGTGANRSPCGSWNCLSPPRRQSGWIV